MTITEIKKGAKDKLNGNWGYPILAYLLCLIPNIIIQGIAAYIVAKHGLLRDIASQNIISLIARLISIVLISPINYGMIGFFIQFARDNEDNPFNTIREGYEYYSNVVLTSLIVSLKIFAWSLLLVIPGIIKSYSYSMTLYVLNDNPELYPTEALKDSENLMYGNRLKLFLLQLSFIGWGLLAGLISVAATLAGVNIIGWLIISALIPLIGVLFLAPYIQLSTAIFYDSLTE